MPIDPNLIILLVEDSAVMRKMEVKVLKSLGIKEVVEAEDGTIAQQKLAGNKGINLIISDWNMPNMDGYELVKWVRAHATYKNLPFIMASGRGEKSEISKAQEAGVSTFIAKPFNGAELEEKIEIALGLKEVTDTSGQELVIDRTAEGKIKLNIAHIQITDHLVLGVLKHLIDSGELRPRYFELETTCMPSWNPLAKSLEDGNMSGAAVLAPIAMDLFAHDVPIKLVLYAHKNGSIFVRNKRGDEYKEPYQEFFKGKSFYIPHMLSIHNILAHMFFNGIGLKYGVQGSGTVDVNFEIVPPVQMPELLKDHADAAGYLVAEPLGTKAIAAGNADLQFLSSELWDNHPCCVITLRKEIIEQHEEAVFEFTKMLVKAGQLIKDKPDLAAEIGVRFLDPQKQLGLKVPILYNVLTEPRGIRTDDLYPVVEDLEYIQHYMRDNMSMGKIIDLAQFVDMRFADEAYRGVDVNRKSSVNMAKNQQVFRKLLYGSTDNKEQRSKALLSREGQYLFFALGDQEYGVNILKIQEIIPIKPIDTLPNTAAYFKGVMMYRGSTVPIIDLGILMNKGEVEHNERTVIIVMEIESSDFSSLIGVLVNSVSEVSTVAASEIDKPKSGGVMTVKDYMIGMAKKGDAIKTLLDMEMLLTSKQALDAVA